jgi:hypothetical protein
MKQLFIAFITLISLNGFAQDRVEVNDANAQKRTLTAGFTAITVSDGISLYLTQGNEESIAVSASEEKYMERFKTVVENGTLKIYYDNSGINWISGGKRKLKAYVSFKSIDKIHASSGADVILKSMVTVNKLQCTLTSGSRFTGQVDIGEMEVSQNSGSEIEISGKTDRLQVEVSSGAIFKGYDMAVDFCQAKASSGGGVRITVNKELNAKANSGGGIRYKGNAVIKDLNVDSGGVVKKASI